MKTYLRFFIIIVMSSFFLSYEIGEQISLEDQNVQFDVCYGSEEHGHATGLISLSDLNGSTNGGTFYVTMIDMAASW